MKTAEVLFITLLCVILGLSLFYYRSQVMGFPITPNTTVESWHVEARVEFATEGNPVRVALHLPRPSSYSIVDEQFISDGYGFTTSLQEKTGNRTAQWTKRQGKSREVIYYRATLYETRSTTGAARTTPPAPTGMTYEDPVFRQLAQDDTGYFALSSIITEAHEKSVDEESFVASLKTLLADAREPRILQIRERFEDTQSDAALEVLILNHAGIPARVMNGLHLREYGRNLRIESWPEIYFKNSWRVYKPETSKLELPQNQLEWWSGTSRFFDLDGGHHLHTRVAVKKHVESALTEAIWRGDIGASTIYDISVFSLPVDAQIVFAVLLLVPIGALVSVFLRQVVGINTFGTFMPVLVALAFRETQLLWGIALFTIIVTVGLIFRSYFDRLQLLLMPRLAAILTMVVLIIYILNIITFKMGIYAGLSISLFPLVILTMLIERISITWEEFGAKTALQATLGSLVTAIIGYAAMSNQLVSHLVVTFPELLLVVLAATLLLGRYNGYKWIEYYRFRMFNKSATK